MQVTGKSIHDLYWKRPRVCLRANSKIHISVKPQTYFSPLVVHVDNCRRRARSCLLSCFHRRSIGRRTLANTVPINAISEKTLAVPMLGNNIVTSTTYVMTICMMLSSSCNPEVDIIGLARLGMEGKKADETSEAHDRKSTHHDWARELIGSCTA